MNRVEFSEGEGMSEWKECSLGEVITLQRGFDITQNQQQVGGYPVVSSSGIKSYHNEWKVKGPGVVIGRKGTLGTVFYIKSDFWAHDTTLWVKDFHSNDPLFVYYFLKEFDLGRYDVGSSNPTLNRNHVHLLPALLPSLPEQKSIAQVLSSLDDKIDLLHRQNKTLESIAETLFRQCFIEEAQEDWEETNLSDHTEVYRGLSYKGSGLSDVGGGLPMHNLNSIFEGGGYKESGIKYYSGEFKERHIVKAGDIIVANTEQGHDFMLIGFPAVVPVCFGESGLFSQHIYRLVPRSNSYLTVAFLYYLLMKPLVREQITSATNGSTVNMLAIDGLQRPKFKLPPKEKIVEFTVMVDAWWKKKEVNQSQIRTLEKLRDTLLPKLMSGEVRVEL